MGFADARAVLALRRLGPLPLVAMLGLSACRSGRVAIDASLADLRDVTEHAVMAPSCADGKLGARCGLLLPALLDPRYQDHFRATACRRMTDEACTARFENWLHVELERRYDAADPGLVEKTCSLDPARCDDPARRELVWLDAHNAGVLGRATRAELALREERAAAVRDDFETAAEVIGATYDVIVGRRCRRAPSAMAGTWTTICVEE